MKFYSIYLVIICILAFILQSIFPGITDALVLNQQSFPEIWRFVTAIFLHGSLEHLVLNMFALILFGLILEKVIGSGKFLLVFFISGIIANIVAVNFYDSSLGASGAIFGVLGTLTVIKPLMAVFVYGIPMPMFIASIVWAIIDILGVFYPQGVGNFAHLSGLALGLMFGFYLRLRHSRKQQQRFQAYSSTTRLNIPENYMQNWENQFMR
ncbi:MAG: rhomboid family intramembrane serine protease [Candidatus Pacearchaeota archaeon]|nr:rhomboid family intramembrane serine protease [Candidatus Pacearchaeota archaeon]